MSTPTPIFKSSSIIDGIQAIHKLKLLNLDYKKILEAGLSGILSRSYCTEYSTKTAPGIIQWDSTVKSLRENFCSNYWEKYEFKGIEGIISKDKTIKIIPSSGNMATGNKLQPASNRNPKGINMINIIEDNNAIQGSLFNNNYFDHIKDNNCKTYVLLYYSNLTELKMELSEPYSITKRGKITAWKERIILDPYRLIEPVEVHKEMKDEDIDIPIRRKFNN